MSTNVAEIKPGLAKLPKKITFFLFGEKSVEKLIARDIAQAPWATLSKEFQITLIKTLPIKTLQAILKVRNPTLFSKRDLGRPKLGKDELKLHFFDDNYVSNYRPSITKVLREEIWHRYCGNVLKAVCWCCQSKEISALDYVVGHYVSVANGGPSTVDNLRPICASCNSAMSNMNMDDYMERNNLTRQDAALPVIPTVARTSPITTVPLATSSPQLSPVVSPIPTVPIATSSPQSSPVASPTIAQAADFSPKLAKQITNVRDVPDKVIDVSNMDLSNGNGALRVARPKGIRSRKFGTQNIPIISNNIAAYTRAIELVYGSAGLATYSRDIAAIRQAIEQAEQSPLQEQKKDDKLTVEPYDESRGLYRELLHNFIVREDDDDEIVVVGCVDPIYNTIRTITAAEISTALDLGLRVESSAVRSPPSSSSAATSPTPIDTMEEYVHRVCTVENCETNNNLRMTTLGFRCAKHVKILMITGVCTGGDVLEDGEILPCELIVDLYRTNKGPRCGRHLSDRVCCEHVNDDGETCEHHLVVWKTTVGWRCKNHRWIKCVDGETSAECYLSPCDSANADCRGECREMYIDYCYSRWLCETHHVYDGQAAQQRLDNFHYITGEEGLDFMSCRPKPEGRCQYTMPRGGAVIPKDTQCGATTTLKKTGHGLFCPSHVPK